MTVLLLTGGLMVMIASYHSLVMHNLRSSNRSYHASAAMNLAESGLEEGMYAINRRRAGDATAYNGWTISGNVATREFANVFTVGTSSSTLVKVAVSNYNLIPNPTNLPKIKVQAILGMPNGMPSVEKWVEIALEAPSTSAPDAPSMRFRGLVAKQAIIFKGNNATVDSWNSDPGRTGTMTHTYNSTTKNDEGFVGSIAVAVDQVLVNNADIKGYVATQRDTNMTNNVGSNGSILADDSPSGTKIDSRRVSTGFHADLPAASAPTVTYTDLFAVSDSVSLPRTGDAYVTSSVKKIIGGVEVTVPVKTYYYKTRDISLTNKVLTVSSDKVVINVAHGSNVDIGGGSGAIDINSGAALEVYASGNFKVAGNGIANGGTTAGTAQPPVDFKLWGTSTTSQTIDIKGNGVLSGIVYAPNGEIFINGIGDVMGAIVGNNITAVGNAAFHYDESLGQLAFGTPADSGDSALVVTLWRELLTAPEKVF